MTQKGLRTGHVVALVGALLTLVSLWRPWYSVTFPQAFRDALTGSGQLGQDPGMLGQLARGLASALPPSIEASGWQALNGADVALCAAAGAVVLVILAAAGAFGGAVKVDPYACGSAIAAAGGGAAILVVFHVVHKPGGAQASDWVHYGQGLWIAATGSGAMLAGGLMAAARPKDAARTPAASAGGAGFARLDPELPPVFAAAPGTPGHGSVPPPTGR
ncbi:MAG TPA: hypothetical protein VI318_23165 [Baekduia sp.]